MEDTYEASVRVRDLPRSVDNTLNRIASMQNKHKWEVIKDALVAYTEKFEEEHPT